MLSRYSEVPITLGFAGNVHGLPEAAGVCGLCCLAGTILGGVLPVVLLGGLQHRQVNRTLCIPCSSRLCRFFPIDTTRSLLPSKLHMQLQHQTLGGTHEGVTYH